MSEGGFITPYLEGGFITPYLEGGSHPTKKPNQRKQSQFDKPFWPLDYDPVDQRWVNQGRVNSVDTEFAAENGILGTLDDHVQGMGAHLRAQYGDGVTEYTLVNNPSNGAIADLWESLLDKLGFTSNPAKFTASVLRDIQASGNNVKWAVHSQGGAIFSEAMKYARNQGATSLSNNSVAFHGGANNRMVTDIIAKSVGIHINDYYYRPWDAVPNIAGMNGSPISMIKSLLACPRLFSNKPGGSPHSRPSSKWDWKHHR